MIIKQIQVFEPTIEQNPLLVCPDHTDFPYLGLQTWTGPVYHQGFHEFMRFMSSPWLSLDNDSRQLPWQLGYHKILKTLWPLMIIHVCRG